MSAILRAYGADFDVDAFLVGCDLPIEVVVRRGDPVFPITQPNGRRHGQSGLRVVVSDAEFDDFPRQVGDAVAFLKRHDGQLRRLSGVPGLADTSIDFGVTLRDVPVQCHTFPAELLRLAGNLGLDLELSQYPAPRRRACGGT